MGVMMSGSETEQFNIHLPTEALHNKPLLPTTTVHINTLTTTDKVTLWCCGLERNRSKQENGELFGGGGLKIQRGKHHWRIQLTGGDTMH